MILNTHSHCSAASGASPGGIGAATTDANSMAGGTVNDRSGFIVGYIEDTK